jgi:sulfur carrier protein
MPRVTVNGELEEVDDGATVGDLLERLGVPEDRLVVELNREVLVPEAYAETELGEGDVLELVRFVGGG